MKKAILIAGAAIVVFIAAMQLLVYLNTGETEPRETALTDTIPAEFGGWQVASEDLGRQDFASEREREVLQYDDYVVRSYSDGETLIQVYLAHWKPGSAPYNRVGTHNPDTCWIVAGMERTDRGRREDLRVAGRPLKPAEYGTYVDRNGRDYHVVFWHLIGDRLYEYDQVGWDFSLMGKIKRGLLVFDDFQRFGFDQRNEQYFVRIHSNKPIFGEDGIWDHPLMREIMAGVVETIPLTGEEGQHTATAGL